MISEDVFLAVYVATSALDEENRKKFLENFLFTLQIQFPTETKLISALTACPENA